MQNETNSSWIWMDQQDLLMDQKRGVRNEESNLDSDVWT